MHMPQDPSECPSVDLFDKAIRLELKTNRRLRRDTIAESYGFFKPSDTVSVLVMEYCEGETLSALVRRNGPLHPLLAGYIFGQILDAVEHCHQRNVAHRDIKSDNLVVSSTYATKLLDFGYARVIPKSGVMVDDCGTIDHKAPEIIRGQPYTTAVDIWSAGVILFTMLAGYGPFAGTTEQEITQLILYRPVVFPDYFCKESRDLLSRILTLDPTQRISISEIKLHPWWTSLQANAAPPPSPSTNGGELINNAADAASFENKTEGSQEADTNLTLETDSGRDQEVWSPEDNANSIVNAGVVSSRKSPTVAKINAASRPTLVSFPDFYSEADQSSRVQEVTTDAVVDAETLFEVTTKLSVDETYNAEFTTCQTEKPMPVVQDYLEHPIENKITSGTHFAASNASVDTDIGDACAHVDSVVQEINNLVEECSLDANTERASPVVATKTGAAIEAERLPSDAEGALNCNRDSDGNDQALSINNSDPPPSKLRLRINTWKEKIKQFKNAMKTKFRIKRQSLSKDQISCIQNDNTTVIPHSPILRAQSTSEPTLSDAATSVPPSSQIKLTILKFFQKCKIRGTKTTKISIESVKNTADYAVDESTTDTLHPKDNQNQPTPVTDCIRYPRPHKFKTNISIFTPLLRIISKIKLNIKRYFHVNNHSTNTELMDRKKRKPENEILESHSNLELTGSLYFQY
ncbi:kinase-like domain-containing protein [Paraphysoderma sedebokerense]|nr:kinase-like domain-containing protein [Paraphysoderma sedebokerense]